MRRVWLLVAGFGLLGAAVGCSHTHGICDCDIPAPGPHPPTVVCHDEIGRAHV